MPVSLLEEMAAALVSPAEQRPPEPGVAPGPARESAARDSLFTERAGPVSWVFGPRREQRMGVWGDQQWDNDGAADFFGSLFPADFHDKVMAALRLDDFDAGGWQEAWAAAWLVHALAHSGYLWPGDMGAACARAAERLEQLAAYDEMPAEPETLRRQAAELRARLRPSSRS